MTTDRKIIHTDVLIIGGGSAGLMAGAIASSFDKKVLILEKNHDFGEKLKITGGGRCNITNKEDDIHKLLNNYGDASKYLYSPFSEFGVQDTFNFFESRGLKLKVEDRKRTFPITEKAMDVYEVLFNELKKNKVDLRADEAVKEIKLENNLIKSVETKNGIYIANSYILATGGLSHPETGSTGDGFKWLKTFDFNISEPSPSIVPLALEKVYKELEGITLKDIKLTFKVDNKKSFSKNGDILFTHFGVSGPTILNSSKKVSDLLREGLVTLHIDLLPTLNEKEINIKLLELFDNNRNKNIKNVLVEIFPSGVSEIILNNCCISSDMKVNVVTSEMRTKIILEIKNFKHNIKGLMGFDKAVIADGGVAIGEIDMKTMRSNKINNLFIVGDLLDVSRPSGGYSLQLCWTTGFVAGKNAAS